MEFEQFDRISLDFLEYIQKAYDSKSFDLSVMQDFFERGLNANSYRIIPDGNERIIETLLGEVCWEIQGQDDDYYGKWVVSIVDLFAKNGLNTTLLDGDFIDAVFDGLRVSTTTDFIFDAVQIILDIGITNEAAERAAEIFRNEAANLYIPFDNPVAAHRFERVIDILKEYSKTSR